MTAYYGEDAAARYDREERGVPGDVAFYVGLARRAEPPVLELGCGTGRVTVAIARAGVPAVGLDLSEPMLRRARRRAAGVRNVRWVLGDMREFRLPERFGLVVVPHRSFQHLLTAGDLLATLQRVHQHLRPGGRLAFNLFNPELPILSGGPPARGTVYGSVPLRYPTRAEVEDALDRAGFAVEALYGDFAGAPFQAVSTEMVWVARPRLSPPAAAPGS
ncbi:MAG TPA: class I SAM-dependent methyltransferase [Dehalococcoidia bacterium]